MLCKAKCGKGYKDKCRTPKDYVCQFAIAPVATNRREKEIRNDERNKCISEVEAFAKEYSEKGVDEADQKAQAWAILQAAAKLEDGLSK